MTISHSISASSSPTTDEVQHAVSADVLVGAGVQLATLDSRPEVLGYSLHEEMVAQLRVSLTLIVVPRHPRL
jgi:hypothetical protein